MKEQNWSYKPSRFMLPTSHYDQQKATQTHEGNMGWKTVSPSSVGGTNYSGFIRDCKTRRHKAISRSIYRMREEKWEERACSSHCLAAFVSG